MENLQLEKTGSPWHADLGQPAGCPIPRAWGLRGTCQLQGGMGRRHHGHHDPVAICRLALELIDRSRVTSDMLNRSLTVCLLHGMSYLGIFVGWGIETRVVSARPTRS
jgi:hypothetical protein